MPVGDFSFYDQVLDMSFTLGNLPARVRGYAGNDLDNYFRVDGTLRDVVRPRRELHAALVSRIKIMASLDIAEKRLRPVGGRRPYQTDPPLPRRLADGGER